MASTGIPYFKAWLIFVISSTVIAFGAGIAVGFVVGAMLGVAGVSIEQIQTICGVLGFVLGLVVSFLIFRWVIERYIVPAVAPPID
jgi:hypothetical protein